MLKIVDIHCHMMPGVDDGSANMAMTGRMLQTASNEGIDSIILTPHYKPGHRHVTPGEIGEFADSLTHISDLRGWDMRFYPGNEIMYHNDCVAKVESGRICTLANTDYVLVEFEPWSEFDRIYNGLREFMYAGYRPVLAHIERYSCIIDKPGRAEEIHNMGCFIQVNASAVMGEEGRVVRVFTNRILGERFADFVATDSHSDTTRAPHIKKCADYVERKYGADYAARIFEGNARKLIEGDEIR